MSDHCPACRVARELTEHRDAAAADWSVRRATLNFARIIAERACPDWKPASEDGAA
jgi:hypothetical protein